MKLRTFSHWRTLIIPLALALTMGACGGDDTPAGDGATGGDTTAGTSDGGDGQAKDGPTITVGSFNFGESVTIAEIYAQAMEDAGYPVERELNLGARELIYQDLESGAIDFLPEYVGSALAVGFGAEPSADTDGSVQQLTEQFEAKGFSVLEPAPAEDKNVFVVTQEFADENDVSTVSDLADLDEVVFGGPPECEDRATCLIGLRNEYGLDNVSFQSIQETPIRVSSLRNGEIDLALMFSTDPPLQGDDLVVLEEDAGIIPAENITPVISNEIVDAYGDELVELIDSISAQLTTEDLIAMNTEVYVNGADSADQARQWLEDNGFI